MPAAITTNTLSEPEQLSSVPAASWSDRLADRYRCKFSADLADWFNTEAWRQTGRGEYREPVSAEDLLGEAPEDIWPGLMPCDLLPLLGNESGDWLCVRFDADDGAAQIVQWYHGGGDWIPWGNSLAEAIVFDVIKHRLPGPARRHAIPAEPVGPASADHDVLGRDPLADWACRHLPPEVARLLDDDRAGEQVVAATLLEHQVAEVAVRCELVQGALKETLSATLDPETAQQLGVDWNDVVQWMFDIQRIPEPTRRRLEADYGLKISKPQDWEAAESHSRRVVELSPDLAWAWDVLGYAAERRDDRTAAIEAYRRAAECSIFTDQSVRLRTHWTADDAAKFSVSRLQQGFPEVVAGSDYLRLLSQSDSLPTRGEVMKHWLDASQRATEVRDWAAAHQCAFAAGWDLGAEPLTAYPEILSHVAETAQQSGQHAREELARTHLRCFRHRYG